MSLKMKRTLEVEKRTFNVKWGTDFFIVETANQLMKRIIYSEVINIYKSMIRPVMMYGAEAWTLTRKEEELLERAEMRMLRWILGVSLRDRRRNEDIREVL